MKSLFIFKINFILLGSHATFTLSLSVVKYI